MLYQMVDTQEYPGWENSGQRLPFADSGSHMFEEALRKFDSRGFHYR